jgi:hypothetical protein
LPAGIMTIVFAMRTPMERAASAEVKCWIDVEEPATIDDR